MSSSALHQVDSRYAWMRLFVVLLLMTIGSGAMYVTGEVLSDANFMAWTKSEAVKLASVTKMLPPYALTYDPTVLANVGAVNTALGLTGAGGGFYNPADPEQP